MILFLLLLLPVTSPYQLLQGRTLRCSLSETKYRLFIGNVPKNWTDSDFKKVIDETGPGAENIELIKVTFILYKLEHNVTVVLLKCELYLITCFLII